MLIFNVYSNYKKWDTIVGPLKKILQKVFLSSEGVIDVHLISSREMKILNFKTRSFNKDTDVISVPNTMIIKNRIFLGDCFISYTPTKKHYPIYYFTSNWDTHHNIVGIEEKLKLEYDRYSRAITSKHCDRDLLAKTVLRAIHSTLHLYGYDHHNPDDFLVMRTKEKNMRSKI